MQSEYTIITYDEFKNRKDGGFYLLYWSDTGRYYGGRAMDYSRRRHDECVDEYDSYLNRHWKKHGSPDTVVVAPLVNKHLDFEQLWLDIFRNGKLYDSAVCMNMSGRADAPWDCQTIEQRRENGRKSKGRKHSLEARAKISAAGRGRKASKETRTRMRLAQSGRKCKPFTKEHLANISAALKGRKFSEEHRAKISVAKMGHKVSEETRAKISMAQRNLTQSQVHEIRHLLALGDMMQKEIAEHFSVGRVSIYDIDKGRTYADR